MKTVKNYFYLGIIGLIAAMMIFLVLLIGIIPFLGIQVFDRINTQFMRIPRRVRFISFFILLIASMGIFIELSIGWNSFKQYLIALVIAILLFILPASRKLLRDELKKSHYLMRYYLLVIFLLPFVLYFILAGVNPAWDASEVMKYSAITVSSTLGGLVFTAATLFNKDKDREKYCELIAVAQKLIIATLLFPTFNVEVQQLKQLLQSAF